MDAKPQGYAVQLGAYKAKHSAERFRTQQQSNLPNIPLAIVAEGSFFKVMAGPFASRAAALEMVTINNIDTYMIKKWPEP